MKLILWSTFFTFSLAACNNPKKDAPVQHLDSVAIHDPIDTNVSAKVVQRMLADTSESLKAPVQVISFSLEQKPNPKYKSITIKYKNKSSKNISSVRFNWVADNGANIEGAHTLFGEFMIETSIKSGQSITDSPSSSIEVEKIKKLFVVQVFYEDGTRWNIHDN